MVVVAGVAAAACASGDGRDLGTPATTEPAAIASTTIAPTTPAPTTSVRVASSPTTLAVTTDVTSVDVAGTGRATEPSTPASTTAPAPTDPVEVVEPVGFERVWATITTAAGEVCDLCLWSATTPQQRSRGLMGVTELGGGDGMVFSYGTPTTTAFWMKNTVMPLTIAFFDADGAYLDAVDMEPCTTDVCVRYPTPHDFVDAIEFRQGTAADFGVGDGSVLDLTDLPCG